jgi:preprotein translocase subunit YajC
MPIIVLYLVLLAAAFFFLIVRPQRRQMAARRALIASVEVGDEVITAGGIYGTVREMDDTKLVVEVAPGVNLTLAREAVSSRPSAELPPPGPALEAGPDSQGEATGQERDDEPDAGERA